MIGVLVSILIGLSIVVSILIPVLIVYSCLIVASDADDEIERYFAERKQDEQK